MIAWAIPKHTKIAKFSDPSRISGPISITRRSLTDCSPNDWNCKFNDPSRIYGQLSFLSDCLAIARRLLGDCLAISRSIAKLLKSLPLAHFSAQFRLLGDCSAEPPTIKNIQKSLHPSRFLTKYLFLFHCLAIACSIGVNKNFATPLTLFGQISTAQ